MLKKSLTSFLLLGVVALALASSGGGKNKKKSSIQTNFSCGTGPSGISLKSGSTFTGSFSIGQKSSRFVLYNTVVTYQKGNTIFILPYKYKLNNNNLSRTNLNAVDLKFRLGR